MGHTLVTSFDEDSKKQLENIIQNESINKIPFDRNCDRDEANKKMDYHMTLIHWSRVQDEIFLNRIQKIKFLPFKIIITESQLIGAESGSLLLYFNIIPGEGFENSIKNICIAMETQITAFLHITLAVSKDHCNIRKIKNRIDERCKYPFEMTVSGLDLYHIWESTYLVDHIS